MQSSGLKPNKSGSAGNLPFTAPAILSCATGLPPQIVAMRGAVFLTLMIAGLSAAIRAGIIPAANTHPDACVIKGNVSIDTGERIYHVPGQRYYGMTKIDPEYGERWFCSEAEARAAGWRKSKV